MGFVDTLSLIIFKEILVLLSVSKVHVISNFENSLAWMKDV